MFVSIINQNAYLLSIAIIATLGKLDIATTLKVVLYNLHKFHVQGTWTLEIHASGLLHPFTF